ncbi:hypothetical protein B0T10DRAFT_543095 [Thelonectria olida]|uniref:Uncharacterized protein n=1 Tax=Thelonectria olida TaxID=1576542 RepID=A0A9P8WHF9_9HYPO|nr:hypothetical protein B0T10DRAFT_543095 [Thelonectria olida]
MPPTALVQISVSRSAEEKLIVPAHRSSLSRRANELTTLRKQLTVDSMGAQIAFGMMDRLSPHAIAISDPMLARLERLHLLLGRALIDLVDRWFSDETARLPHRMPLDPEEEVLLQWVAGAGFVPRFAEHVGCWRSDVLFGRSSDDLDDEAPYICEINGRLPLNGILVTGLSANGVSQLGLGQHGVETLNSLEDSYLRLIDFFDPSKPLYCVREKWPGVDSSVLLPTYTARTKQPTGVVRPADLELRPDETSPTGYALWDRSTSTLMEQWFVEMLQDEWASLDPAVARQLALTPLNDLRTVLLVHDKRLLGILVEEIPGMVSRGVLTAEEGDIVAAGIAETIIPGSAPLQTLLRESTADPAVKDSYVYKPCRDGSGRGVELGRNLSQAEWLARLSRLASADVLRPHQHPAVIQRLVDHHWYDVVRHEVPGVTGPEPQKFHLIGSMHVFQSRRFNCGPWRLGLETHLGMDSESPGLMMSSVRLPEWLMCTENEDEAQVGGIEVQILSMFEINNPSNY